MTTTNSVHLDETVLYQYIDAVGVAGMLDTVAILNDVLPNYTEVLVTAVAERNESAVRTQAHKIKGACRTVGLIDLAADMQWLERDSWQWLEAAERLQTWQEKCPVQQQELITWLTKKAST